MNNFGYCCINLSNKKLKVNRGLKKASFLKFGLEEVGRLAELNLRDLKSIIEWNIENDIKVYRMSSDMFPWMSEYEFESLPNFNVINGLLKSIGSLVLQNKLRVGFHPGQFNVLSSQSDIVVKNTIIDINKHAEILDLMGLEQSHYYGLNIHINNTKPSKEFALNRFIESFNKLSESAKKRLTVENDDKPSQYGINDLLYLHSQINIPIVFDFLHFQTGPSDDLELFDALKAVLSTWPKGVQPLTHYSSSRINEDASSLQRAHADYIYEKIETFGFDFDIELECKAKDLGLLKYRADFLNS